MFLDACSSVYAVFPVGQDNQGQPFMSKHFNVIDPLRVTNNLGRSVSKGILTPFSLLFFDNYLIFCHFFFCSGNFYRIRSAFALGAKRLARLLDCPKENLVTEVNQFFSNTWDRHGNGIRPDAPVTDSLVLQSDRMLESVRQETVSDSITNESAQVHANKGQRNLKSFKGLHLLEQGRALN